MKVINTKSIIIGSVAAVLLFSIGFMQESEAGTTGVPQGTLTINNQCTLTIPAQGMDFGTADDGDFVNGFFDVRNVGNVAAVAPTVDGAPTQNGFWYIAAGPTNVISNTDTDVFTGSPTDVSPAPFADGVNLGDLSTPRALPNIAPDFLSPANNDERVDLETFVNLLIAVSGAVVLDVLVTNTGCA